MLYPVLVENHDITFSEGLLIDTCKICKMGLQNDKIMFLPCGHYFHDKCVFQLLIEANLIQCLECNKEI